MITLSNGGNATLSDYSAGSVPVGRSANVFISTTTSGRELNLIHLKKVDVVKTDRYVSEPREKCNGLA